MSNLEDGYWMEKVLSLNMSGQEYDLIKDKNFSPRSIYYFISRRRKRMNSAQRLANNIRRMFS